MTKLKKALQSTAYFSLRTLLFPLSCLPLSQVHAVGRFLGNITFFFAPKRLKKTTYNNLALAEKLNLSNKDIRRIARLSFQNIVIIALEYFCLKKYRHQLQKIVTGHQKDNILKYIQKGQGVIAVTGHISNWELCFLDFTQRADATTVGKPIRNRRLYNYIQSIRTMYQGKVIIGKNALSQGMKTLNQGKIFSMVNDQSYPPSYYSYPFLGARAWTSPSPALLAYRTNSPIVVVTTTRSKKGTYDYHISEPLWPNRKNRLKSEVSRLMDEIMKRFENHLIEHPDQWLWQHKRWKQEGFHRIYSHFKADSILFVLPQKEELFEKVKKALYLIPQIYTRSFLTFLVPRKFKDSFNLKNVEVHLYDNEADLFLNDYRFQMVYDFNETKKLKKHFLKLGAHRYFSLSELSEKISMPLNEKMDARRIFKEVVCLSNTPFQDPSEED